MALKKKVVRKAKPKKKKPVKKAVKKSKVRKSAAKNTKKTKKARKAPVENFGEKIGEVTHYFPHVNAAAVKMSKSGLKAGDNIRLKGHTTDFIEIVASIQLDHASISEAKKGQEIGLLVKSRVRQGDKVYKV